MDGQAMAGRGSLAGAAAVLAAALGWRQLPVQAGPVVCTTTLEAPLAGSGPVGMTRCGSVLTTPQLLEQRFHSYSSPYARGIDITHQITDILGIAMGGGDGTRVMGFGFPDQTIVWDGSALETTYQTLLEEQSHPMPWRTADVHNGFCQGLPQGRCNTGSQPGSPQIRGLW